MKNDPDSEYGSVPSKSLYGLPATVPQRTSAGGVQGILATLFRGILFDLNVGPAQLHAKTRSYCDAMKNRDQALLAQQPESYRGLKQKTSHYNPGIALRELMSPKMTIKVFFKGMRILDVIKVEFKVTIWRRNRPATTHGCMVDIANEDDQNFHNSEDDDADAGSDPSTAGSTPPQTE